jgi:Family of unknown function (DUF5684)
MNGSKRHYPAQAWATGTARFRPGLLASLWAALLLPLSVLAGGTAELHFDVLQIGTRSYTNVTVTTKNTNYVFIMHSRGMESLRVKDLPHDALVTLGFISPAAAAAETNNTLKAWTGQTLAKIETPEVRQYEKASQAWITQALAPFRSQSLIRSWTAQAALGALVICYILFGYAGKLICEKAGRKAGVLIWLPVLHVIALLRAAGMSAWWLLAYFVPVLNLIAYIVWCVKIVKAVGKGGLTAFFLILPGTNILAFLYLGFSASEPPPESPKVGAPMAKEETAFVMRT